MRSVDVLLPVVAVLTALIGLGRVGDLRPGAVPARQAVATAVWGIAVASTFLTPAVAAALTRVTRVANLDEPLARTALMISASGAQAIFLLAEPDERGRRRVARRRVVTCLGIVALWTAFLCAPHYDPSTRYYLDHGSNPWVTAMLVITVSFLGWCFVDLLLAWRRFGRRASGPVRIGLALMAVGALTGLAWVVVKLGGQLAVLTYRGDLQQLSIVPAVVLAALTALLTVTGVVCPSLSAHGGRLVTWWGAYRSKERLYPCGVRCFAYVPLSPWSQSPALYGSASRSATPGGAYIAE